MTARLSHRQSVTLFLVALGAVGGVSMSFLPVPMPFMMGSLLAAALLVAFRPDVFPDRYAFPVRLRGGCTAVIGALIGARVDSTFVSRIPEMWVSLLAVTAFVSLGHVYCYQLLRRGAGYDPATAYFSGTPGGLIESIELGQAAGADVRLLTLHHYLRVIFVIVLVPSGLSLIHGEALGSASGLQLSGDAVDDLSGIPLLVLVAGTGFALGTLLKLPAGALLGALTLSALGSVTGLVTLHAPDWVINVAQVVIGVSLGTRFVGVTLSMVLRAAVFAFLAIGGMLAIGVVLAIITAPLVGEGVEVLLISMAPGGLIEMGLVALSLSVNPAFVTFHHLYRIALAVIDVAVVGRWLGFAQKPAAGHS